MFVNCNFSNRSRVSNLLRTYLLLTGQTTKEGGAWLDEFQTNRDFQFNRGY